MEHEENFLVERFDAGCVSGVVVHINSLVTMESAGTIAGVTFNW